MIAMCPTFLLVFVQSDRSFVVYCSSFAEILPTLKLKWVLKLADARRTTGQNAYCFLYTNARV